MRRIPQRRRYTPSHRGLRLCKNGKQRQNSNAKASLSAAPNEPHGLISKQTATLDGVSVTRVTFDVGAKWSQDLKSYAGTHSCELPHVALVLAGTLRFVMENGSEEDFSKDDVMMLPPGHDASTVGDDKCVFVEFSKGGDFYE